nr:MAG TPA: hypothetical protein [Caudoviricetes sp.]
MSIICGSLTEEDNSLPFPSYLIPDLNFFSELKLRLFWNEFKMILVNQLFSSIYGNEIPINFFYHSALN